MCIPFRLIERICPFGRILAVPPPLSDTCLPGAGRLPVLATPLVPPVLEPLVRFVAAGVPVLPAPPALPFLPAVPVPVRPAVPALAAPGVVWVPAVPGLAPFVDE